MVTPDAIVIRTLPNLEGKKAFEIFTNPPYLEEDAARFIRESGINIY
jgi:hypothetical protein